MESNLTHWDYRWIGEAKLRSAYSKDPSTKVGAVIANGKHHISFGFNGFPPSCPDLDEYLYDRTSKYKLVVHAEANAILNAARKEDIRGATLYSYPLAPCPSCSTLLAAAGIQRVVALIDPSASSSPSYLDTTDTEFVLNANEIEYYFIRTH